MLMCCCFFFFRLNEEELPGRWEGGIDISLQLEDELDGRVG
jgi:hypothetical protein